jgi:hypothetical protein
MVTAILKHYEMITEDKPEIEFKATQTVADCCAYHSERVIYVDVYMQYKERGRNEQFAIVNRFRVYYLMLLLSFIDSILMPAYHIDQRKKMETEEEVYMSSLQIDGEMWNQRLPNSPLNLIELCRVSVRKRISECNPDKDKTMTSKGTALGYFYSLSVITPCHDVIAQLPLTIEMKNYLNFWRHPPPPAYFLGGVVSVEGGGRKQEEEEEEQQQQQVVGRGGGLITKICEKDKFYFETSPKYVARCGIK